MEYLIDRIEACRQDLERMMFEAKKWPEHYKSLKNSRMFCAMQIYGIENGRAKPEHAIDFVRGLENFIRRQHTQKIIFRKSETVLYES